MGEPDADHQIILRNVSTETRQMSLLVEQDEIIYEEEFTLQSGEVITPYNIKQANPTGVEHFDITVETRHQSESETLTTTKCYGDLVAEVQDDEGVSFQYTIIC